MEYPGMEDDFQSEGTSSEEDLEEPVKTLPPEFFDKVCDDTTTLFRQYFKAIKKNRYLLTLIDEVLQEVSPCYVYTEAATSDDKHRHKEYPLPKLSGKPQKDNPGASEKILLTKMKGKGRGLEAVSEIDVGENLIVEKALAFKVYENCACHRLPHYICYYCSNPIFKFVPCHHCDVCLFCDEKCLKEAWESYHQFECYGIQRHFWTHPYTATGLRMMLVFVNKASVNETPAESVDNFNVLNTLETHMSRYSIREMNSILHASARTLVYLIERTNFFQKMMIDKGHKSCKPYYMYMYVGGLLVRFTCAARTGALELPIENILCDPGDSNFQSIAFFVSKTANMLNHSCKPNCILLHNKNYIIVRALKHIKPKEELTICYLSVQRSVNYTERMYHCSSFFFTCRCELCTEPESTLLNTYLCRFCPLGRFCSFVSPPRCMDCNKEDKFESFKLEVLRVNNLLKEFKITNTLQSAENCVSAAEKLYYPFSYELAKIFMSLYRIYLDNIDKFIVGCDLVISTLGILKQHADDYALRYYYDCYRMTLEVIHHENFAKVEWRPVDSSLLNKFKRVLEDAHTHLNLCYELDQLEFLKNAIKEIDEVIVTIDLEDLELE